MTSKEALELLKGYKISDMYDSKIPFINEKGFFTMRECVETLEQDLERLEILEKNLEQEKWNGIQFFEKYKKLQKVIDILKNKKITTGLIDGYYQCYDNYIELLKIEYDLDKKYFPTKEEFNLINEVLENE